MFVLLRTTKKKMINKNNGIIKHQNMINKTKGYDE